MRGCTERDYLLPVAIRVSNTRWLLNCCIRSKAACFILLWNFAALLIYILLSVDTQFIGSSKKFGGSISTTASMSIFAIFAPMAGLLTDLKYSRHKTTVCSSYFLLVEVASIFPILIIAVLFQAQFKMVYPINDIIGIFIVGIFLVTLLVFLINSLRFGMDQLHDCPTEDSILFIHWYVWVYYFSSFLIGLPSNLLVYYSNFIGTEEELWLSISGTILSFLVLIMILALLVFSLCIIKYRKRWFLIEPPGPNPYKLVYGVFKFACQHKVPLRRSAFTYCEDELPSRLDLGKLKYGGPFTTKQVEDVKAFWGILKVVSSIGPAFMIEAAAQAMLPAFAQHSYMFRQKVTHDNITTDQEIHIEGLFRHIFISNGLLSPLLVAVCIPLYLSFIRPRIYFHLPGMLKRIGLGIVLLIVSLSITLAMDVAVHALKTDTNCMFRGLAHKYGYTTQNISSMSPPLFQNSFFFISQHILAALSNMLIDITVFEFILSQSPYSMKGLLLGYFFSVRSLFQAITMAFVFLFAILWKVKSMSCGSGFYLMNIGVGVLTLVLYTIVAKRYKYRTVNEPSNEYRYAEDYYSNIQ